jgi:hypothetical protein
MKKKKKKTCEKMGKPHLQDRSCQSPVATVGIGLLGGRTGVELVISLTGATAMPATQAIAQLRGGDGVCSASQLSPNENLEVNLKLLLEGLQLRVDFRETFTLCVGPS